MKQGGESQTEATKQTSRLLTRTTRIGAFNVQTMFQTGKAAQIAAEKERYNIEILGLSETRWVKTGQRLLNNRQWILYSGHPEEDADHSEGVAIMLSKSAKKSLLSWEGHGPRHMTAQFTTKNKGINMNIIQGYAPTNDSDPEAKDQFYDKLQSLFDQFPKKDVNIVMGDFNAKIGSDNTGAEEVMGKHGLGEANDNGERFTNFCAMNDMVIGGSVFPHKRIHKVTWISPDHHTENQIDHICISRKFRNTMEDVRAYRGADVASDHQLVMGKFRLKLKKTGSRNKQDQRLKYNTHLLKDRTVVESFKLALRNRFEALANLTEEDDQEVEKRWADIKEVYNTTCKEELGQKEHQHKEWISKTSWDKIKERRKKKEKLNACKTRQTKAAAHQEYTEANREVKNSLRSDKRKFMEDIAETAEQAVAMGNMKEVYDATKKLCGKYSRPEVPVKNKDNRPLSGQEAQLQRWAEHFEELLNRPAPEEPPDIEPAANDLDINCDVPTREEIARAISKLNNGKAAGPDYIPAEALKVDIGLSVEILHQLFEKIWMTEDFPEDWREGHLIKLPKKGDLSQCKNYRGITLLSITGKVFNRIVLERMKDTVDIHLRDNQAGFRKNRSCLDQIATLRIIAEQSLEWNSPLLINFVDYEKAFDSIHRETLWRILRHYGIPNKIVQLIQGYYKNSNCRVIHDGQFTKSFEIKTGVKQGCILSPFLFLLTIDWIMKTTTSGKKTGIQWTLWSQLEDLDFADDLALLSHSHQQMRAKTDYLVQVSKQTGLKVHPDKTKILKINHTVPENIEIDGKPIEEVESFTYLGSIVDRLGGTEEDVKSRIGKARRAFMQLGNVWKSGSLSNNTKLRLFNTNVKSVLLYGSETWRLTKGTSNKLQTFVNSCLRKILRIHYPDTIRNEDLWRQTRQTKIDTEIKRRRWRWIGHTLRKPPTNITNQSLQWNPQGSRSRGRPRNTWKREVEAELREMESNWHDVRRLAQDRTRWRGFVGGLYSGVG